MLLCCRVPKAIKVENATAGEKADEDAIKKLIEDDMGYKDPSSSVSVFRSLVFAASTSEISDSHKETGCLCNCSMGRQGGQYHREGEVEKTHGRRYQEVFRSLHG